MNRPVLECCVDTLESAIAAQRGGATRLELCANLVIGGTTPSPFLLEQVQRACSIPVRCMVRPRFGDFCYTSSEYVQMQKQVAEFRAMGAEGVVFGVLLPDGALDTARMGELCGLAHTAKVTLHRAFDLAADPMQALRRAEALGVDTILTSGQRPTAWEGRSLLARLQRAAERVSILAGGGVNAGRIAPLFRETGIRCYHLSASRTVPGPMVFQNPSVSMGLAAVSEYERRECDAALVAAARSALDAVFPPA